MAVRKAGRPRTIWKHLKLKLHPEAIKNMQAIALSEGFVIKQGDRMGEPSISAWLNSTYKPKE